MYQAPEVQERESEQVVGTINGIVQKGPDRWQAAVLPDGSQYTRNLWTKDEQLVYYLVSQIGNRLAFDCGVSNWERDGKPVRSLWINAVGSVSPGSPAMQGPPPTPSPGVAPAGGTYYPPTMPTTVVQPQVIPVAPSQDSTEKKIHRQTATKVAAILLSNLAPEQRNLSTLLELAERLVKYYDHGLPPTTLDDEIARAMPRSVDEGPPPEVVPEAFTGDDDIPF